MKRILLTGMSGTGKSTVVAALGHRGFAVVDADDGWCTTAADGEWVWDEPRIDELLAIDDGDADADVLVIAGCASNQGRFRRRFDLVVLLSAPLDVMLHRVRTRVSNPFGKQPGQIEQIIADHAEIEPLLRATADHEIDTDRPMDEVVDEVVRLAETLDL